MQESHERKTCQTIKAADESPRTECKEMFKKWRDNANLSLAAICSSNNNDINHQKSSAAVSKVPSHFFKKWKSNAGAVATDTGRDIDVD